MAMQGQLSNRTLGNKYLLGELLGYGGFGEVYKAQNLFLNRPQAIKVILEKHLSDPKFRERFIREARTLAALNHPNIVHIDDFELEYERAYLVMPFIGGGTLHSILVKAGPLPLAVVEHYLKQICAALIYAHAQHVIHLDLKPENLLHQDENDVLLLSDFGLAHLMKQGVVVGGTSLGLGSSYYMAPEQIMGKPDAHSDIYALGVLLYHMLAGSPPFEGSAPGVIALKHVMEPPPPLSAKRSDLPSALGHVIEKALTKDPYSRFASVQEFATAFEQACQPRLSFSPPTPSSKSPLGSKPTILGKQLSMSFNSTVPIGQPPLQPSPITSPGMVPKGLSPAILAVKSQLSKRGISRRVFLVGLVGALIASGFIISWLLLSTGSPVILTGSLTSISAANHSMTLNVNRQLVSINGLTDQEVALLEVQLGKIASVSIRAIQNSDGSYTIAPGRNSITFTVNSGTPGTNGKNGPSGPNEPGTITFIGTVHSVSSSNIVVSLPDGSTLSMAIVIGQTDLSSFYSALPSVSQLIKVDAAANTSDGSFIATSLQQADSNDNIVDYQGVTTQAVGSDLIIHFRIGNKDFSFTIGPGTDLKDFNNDPQSIGNNVGVKVKVQFQGTTGTVIEVMRG